MTPSTVSTPWTRRLRSVLWTLGAATLLAAPAHAAAQAAALTPLGSNQTTLSECDDCYQSVSLTDVFPSGVQFGGTVYTELYIGSNGYVTFGHGNRSYSPAGITAYTQGPIVAPQFDDLAPYKGGDIFYDQNAGAGHVVATWQNVAPYNGPVDGSGGNTFQVVLRRTDGDDTNFEIEIRYVDLQWARAEINSSWPTAGWSAGDLATYAELPESGQPDFRNLQFGSNVGSTGVYRWEVVGGVVQSIPTVNSTAAATAITGTSARSGGNVSSDGGLTVTARGVVHGTTSNPSTSDATVPSGAGTGSFTVDLTGLSAGTTYYVRAFATNSLGTAYGPERSFTTLSIVPPTVTTADASPLTARTGTGGGEVTSDGGALVTARGLAWATAASPTIADDTRSAGSGTGTFSADLSDLDPGTTYHVRAWATNSAGTGYGGDVTFTTPRLDQTITFPALDGRTYGDGAVQLEASASSDLAVSYDVDDPTVATVSGDELILVGAGTATVTASQAGDGTWNPAPDVSRTITVESRPVQGSFGVPAGKRYDGNTVAVVLARHLHGVLPQDEADVTLAGGSAHYGDPDVGPDKIVSLTGANLGGPRADDYRLTNVHHTRADIVAGAPDHLAIEGPPSMVVGHDSDPLTLVVRDTFGHAAPLDCPVTVALVTDGAPDAATFSPSTTLTLPAGSAEASFTYQTTRVGDGLHRIRAFLLSDTPSQTSGASAKCSPLSGGAEAVHDLAVVPAGVATFLVEAERGGPLGPQRVDVPIQLRITALDALGNVAQGFEGTVRMSSAGTVVSGGTSVTFSAGVLDSHAVTMGTPGTFALTATAGDGAATGTGVPFTVSAAGVVAGFRVEAAGGGPLGPQVVDSTFHVRLTALDQYGGVAHSFDGSVALTSDGVLAHGATTTPFVDGVLESHEVAMGAPGQVTLTPVLADGGITGTSPPFTVSAPGALVEVAITIDDDRPAPGDLVTVEVTVTNRGLLPAYDVRVPDPLSGRDRLVRRSLRVDRGEFDLDAGTWSVGRLEPGQSATMRLTALVMIP